MDDTEQTKPLGPVVGLSKKAIAELSTEELVTTAVLYGCIAYRGESGASYWYLKSTGYGGVDTAYTAARDWLRKNGHDEIVEKLCYPAGN